MEYSSFDADLKPALRVPFASGRYEEFHRERDADLGQLASQLTKLASSNIQAGEVREVDARLVRRLIAARRVRDALLPPGLFGDPVWDMLLDLTAARLESRLVAVSSLCIAACVPTTTALRAIKALCDSGLLERCTDPADGRRTYITLSEPILKAMLACIARIAATIAT